MTTKWQLNQQYMKDCIETGFILLEDKTLSKPEIMRIKKDIQTFEQYLSRDFENYQTSPKSADSLKKLKEYILRKMKRQYLYFGEDLIDFIIALSEEDIFKMPFVPILQTNLSIDTQAELTIKNYERHSKILLPHAKQIISAKPTRQIQLVKDLNCCSYCHYSIIANLPFLIINPLDGPTILNHELEHGIEFTLGYNPHELYDELGPILFELLFLDILYEKQGFLYPYDYQERIEEASDEIKFVAQYFELMCLFAQSDFHLSTDEFEAIFFEETSTTPQNFPSYLNKEIASSKIERSIQYLLSYLKAIELREQTKRNNSREILDILLPYMHHQEFDFRISKESFTTYRSFITEMKQKTRTKKPQ